ncbi:MAG: hypothetical protein H6714_10600 [Myxococcales bacterium]|nr:hypothetical protein [Myxococcales bacterium]
MRTRLAYWALLGVSIVSCSDDSSVPPPPPPDASDAPAEEVECTTPPDPECTSNQILRRYELPGTADEESTCQYAFTDTTCQTGCEDATCIGEPCAGIECNAPPGAQCENSSQLRVYENVGVCDEGACQYGSALEDCPHGCDADEDACVPDPCADIVCNAPPPAECVDDDTLKTYTSPGVCDNGDCTYSNQLTECAYGCNATEKSCNDGPPPLIQLRNFDSCAGKNLNPVAGEEQHWTAVRLEPPYYPFTVEEVEYRLADYFDTDSGVRCQADFAHKVQIYKANSISPPASPSVLSETSVPAVSWTDTYRTVRFTLATPITITASDDIFVAMQFAGTYPEVTCISLCGSTLEPAYNFWSNAAAAPYTWQPLSTWNISGHVYLTVWGR